MQSGWRIGTLFNIPLFIDPSWFFIVAFLTYQNGSIWQQRYATWTPTMAYGAGLVMALLLFASVLLHELGHSLVAKSKGIDVTSIRLFLFGGVASIEKEPQKPGDMFQVAVAGPLVSLSLWLICSALVLFTPITSPIALVILSSIASLNLTLTLFNLIPGLPLDGGQMLKALVWKQSGDYLTGAHWAARSGLWLGWVISIVGFADVLGLTELLGLPEVIGFWGVLIGWFMRQNAVNADRLTDVQAALLSLDAQSVMTRDYRVLDGHQTLRQFAEEMVLKQDDTTTYFVASDGRYRGLITMDMLQNTERSLWDSTHLEAIAQPLQSISHVTEKMPLPDVIQQMDRAKNDRITVLTPAGAVAGVIDRGDITRAVGEKLGFSISPALLKQIKASGDYPPGLQLGRIAESVLEFQGKNAIVAEVATETIVEATEIKEKESV
jgi:Zn-dependent protease